MTIRSDIWLYGSDRENGSREARTEGKHGNLYQEPARRVQALFFRREPFRQRHPVVNGQRAHTLLLDPDAVSKALTRIAHEIIERNDDLDDVVVVGLQSGGTWIAEALVTAITGMTGKPGPSLGFIDVAMYRDDVAIRPVSPVGPSSIPCDLTGRTVILVDDVLFTGRTVRAALEALNDHGRPRCVRLVVMVDRGHRELPIRPDYVGKNLPTRVDDEVIVTPEGVTVSNEAMS